MNGRPLALGAASGSLASLAVRFFSETFEVPLPAHIEESLCQCDLASLVSETGISWQSFLLGLLVGIIFWPVLELLVLFRTWWRFYIRRQLAEISKRTALYKVL